MSFAFAMSSGITSSRVARQGTKISWNSPAARHSRSGSDDEGKRATMLHGFFQGAYGKHKHRKINFRQVSKRFEAKVNRSYHRRTPWLVTESRVAIISNNNGLLIYGINLISYYWQHPLALLWALF